MLLTPLGILRILNLICACPGVEAGRDEGELYPLVVKIRLLSRSLCFWNVCYQVVIVGTRSLPFISEGSKEPAKHRGEWEVAGAGGPCSSSSSTVWQVAEGFSKVGRKSGPGVLLLTLTSSA